MDVLMGLGSVNKKSERIGNMFVDFTSLHVNFLKHEVDQ